MAKTAKVEKAKPTKADLHIKAHGKKERVKASLAGRELKDVSTKGIRNLADELDIPGFDFLSRADLEVAIRTILGVEAEGKPE